jgi:hypothetical protein
MALTTQQKIDRMMAQNRAASYDSNITDTMNAFKAIAAGPSGGGQPSVSSVQPVSGAPAQAKQNAGGGGKGGRPDIDPSKVADSKYNNDKNYGYYRPDGTYVSAFVDMRDGGGKNQSGNYFVGGGLFSALANALKIRPAGAASERDPKTGEYIVPREDIGYANVTDMFDRGGPQARGGKFQGAGGYSGMANFLYGLSGNEFGERVPYGSSVQPSPTGRGVSGGSSASATPTFVSAPTTSVSIGQGNTTPLSYGDQRPPEAIGINEILQNRNRGFHPTISPLTMPAASVSNPNYATYEGNPVTQMETPSMFSSGVNSTDFSPAYDPAMFGADSTTSTDVGRRRMDNLNTIPSGAVGTPAALQYERYLRAGGQLLFPEFVNKMGY